MTRPTLFPTSDDDLLTSVYQKQGRTLDDLPYTEQFEALYCAMYGDADATDTLEDAPDASGQPTRAQVFHRLHNLRKAGKLPRLGRAVGQRPRINAEQEALLVSLVEDEVGAISKRDQLIYTAGFEQVCTCFNTQAALELDRHAVWRLIAKLAK